MTDVHTSGIVMCKNILIQKTAMNAAAGPLNMIAKAERGSSKTAIFLARNVIFIDIVYFTCFLCEKLTVHLTWRCQSCTSARGPGSARAGVLPVPQYSFLLFLSYFTIVMKVTRTPE